MKVEAARKAVMRRSKWDKEGSHKSRSPQQDHHKKKALRICKGGIRSRSPQVDSSGKGALGICRVDIRVGAFKQTVMRRGSRNMQGGP
jgi:hypothetical protein